VLQQADCLLFHQLIDHVAQDSANGVEALVCLANICQSHVVEEYLLHDEDGDGLGELGAGLHDSKAEWDNLGGKEEVDDFARVIFYKSANNAEGCEAEVFKWSGFGRGIEEGIEEKWDVCCIRY
jgi:hypothetical protein